MAVYCPHCSTANREGSRYCNKCGEELAAAAPPEAPVITAPEPITEDDAGDAAQDLGESDVISLAQVPATPPVPRFLDIVAPPAIVPEDSAPVTREQQPETSTPPAPVQMAETSAPATPTAEESAAAAATAEEPAPIAPLRGQRLRLPQPLVRVRPSASRRPPEPPQNPQVHDRSNLWRRLSYLVLAVAIVIGVLLPTGTLGKTTTAYPEVTDLYNTIQALPLHSTVLVSFDYEPATADEMGPLATAVISHLMQRQARILTMSLLPQGPALAADVLRSLAEQNIYAYGADYVNLGFFSGDEAALASLGSNLTQILSGDDAYGQPLADQAATRGVRSISAINLVIEIAGDEGGVPRWVEQVQSRNNVRLAAATSAVAMPLAFPYKQSGQLVGLASGLPAAAQYEQMLAYTGQATRGMDAQSLGHLVILLFIVLGNIGLIFTRWRSTQ